jgi:hypothetical protein
MLGKNQIQKLALYALKTPFKKKGSNLPQAENKIGESGNY